MKFPTLAEIKFLNKRTVQLHGGNYVPPENILNQEPLLYVVEAINAEMFGSPLYPSVADKAAVYMYTIISGHIFSDGNKRTGLGVALTFLDNNGYHLVSVEDRNQEITNSELFEFTTAVASGQRTLDETRQWFALHIAKI